MTNHPVAGGSHLPDITGELNFSHSFSTLALNLIELPVPVAITPVFDNDEIIFFVAARGHHADVSSESSPKTCFDSASNWYRREHSTRYCYWGKNSESIS